MTWLTSNDGDAIYETQNGGLYYFGEWFGFENISPNNVVSDRVNWDMPYVVNEQEDYIIAGTYRLLRMDGVPFGWWTPISPDLTKVSTGDFVGNQSRYTITEIREDQFDSNVIYCGGTDGWVWRGNSSNGEYTWTNIADGLPSRYVTAVRTSPNQEGRVFVGFSGYRVNDYTPYLFKSDDFGNNWQNISGDLPNVAVYDVLEIPSDEEKLFVATEVGVFYTENGGQNWEAVGTGMPLCTTTELALDIPNKKLIAGTFARSMYSYDVSWIEINESDAGLNNHTQNDIVVYPNPASAVLHVQNVTGNYEIYSLLGTKVMSGTVSSEMTSLNINNLPEGVYFLRCGDRTVKFTKR
jgi:hypothetical protein